MYWEKNTRRQSMTYNIEQHSETGLKQKHINLGEKISGVNYDETSRRLILRRHRRDSRMKFQ